MDFSTFTNFVDGRPRTGEQTYHGVNPSTEEPLHEVPCATEQDLNDAVEAAQHAFPTWSKIPYGERCDLVRKYADAYLELLEPLTELLMQENGKPRSHADREIRSSYECLVGITTLTLPTEYIEDETKTAKLTYLPLGVVGAICPWNFPLLLSMAKVAAALVTGNCIIVKPSPFTPYTTLKAVEVGQSIFPPGVLQVLGGNDELGPWMVKHPGIRKISFTGSIATGKKIMENAAGTLKRISLELGGNDPAIVFEDVDIEQAAQQVSMSAFKNAGQICVASKRIYVHESIYQPFLKAMAEVTKGIKIGDPCSDGNDGIDIGPIQNRMQYEKVKSFFADCNQNGYEFITGGNFDFESMDNSNNRKGFFVSPTIIASPPANSKIVVEEPFGPIVPVMPFSNESEVIRAANDTNAGLGACIWSKDIERAERVASQIEAGSVFINSPLRPDWRMFFAGRKESGIGGERGVRGLMEYCDPLAVHIYK